jgi:hypothetical protein
MVKNVSADRMRARSGKDRIGRLRCNVFLIRTGEQGKDPAIAALLTVSRYAISMRLLFRFDELASHPHAIQQLHLDHILTARQPTDVEHTIA